MASADTGKHTSDLLLFLNFIPSKFYPPASPADSRKGTHTEHIHTYTGTERCAGGGSARTGTPLWHTCKSCFNLGKRRAPSQYKFKALSPVLLSGRTAAAPHASTSQQDSCFHSILQEHCLILCLIKKDSHMAPKQQSVPIILGTTMHMTAEVSTPWGKPPTTASCS